MLYSPRVGESGSVGEEPHLTVGPLRAEPGAWLRVLDTHCCGGDVADPLLEQESSGLQYRPCRRIARLQVLPELNQELPRHGHDSDPPHAAAAMAELALVPLA
jgi:hypothetical protein